MSRIETSRALLERNDSRFIDLAHTFTKSDWETPSLCAGWTNHDVLAHLVVGGTASLASVAAGMFRRRGSFDQTNTAMTKELAARYDPTSLLDLYEGACRSRTGIGRLFPNNLLLGDHVLHELDIVLALDLLPTIEPAVLRAVLQTEVAIPNPFVPAMRTAAGLDLVAPDVDWSRPRGGGTTSVTGPGWAIASVLANRPSALGALLGDGVDVLTSRLADRGHVQPGAVGAKPEDKK